MSADMPSGGVDASGSLTARDEDVSADAKKPKKGGLFGGIFGSSKSKTEVR